MTHQQAQRIGAVVFLLAGLALAAVSPSNEIAWVTALLLFTVFLFAFEVVAVDLAALLVLVLVGFTDLLAPLMGLEQGLVPARDLFDGFASNAVISIVGVMIIGAGLDKAGLMSHVAAAILRLGRARERRILALLSASVALVSSFVQNVAAAALFLPVAGRIAARTGIPMSRLAIPLGFCTILGGTLTLVGSSPLILLNDLMLAADRGLPPDQRMAAWSLLAPAPVGLALVATGILYFLVAGRLVLPVTAAEAPEARDPADYFRDVYGISCGLYRLRVSAAGPLAGRSLDEIEREQGIRVVAVRHRGEVAIGAASLSPERRLAAGDAIAVLADPREAEALCTRYGCRGTGDHEPLEDALSPLVSGIAELVVPPGSHLIGRSARELAMRRTHGVSLIGLHRAGTTLRGGEGVGDIPLQAGDALVVHTTWEALARLESDRDLVVVTGDYPREALRPHKVPAALLICAVTLALAVTTDLRLALCLFAGALGMMLAGVLSPDEAYGAVSWRTVFLVASLLPLGTAVEQSGTAAWIAGGTLGLMGTMPVWVVQAALALLATGFTLVMSNIGATVLLVPLAVDIARGIGADPAVFALTVALAASNSFVIPTHQVNALIMGPGGYRVADFLRAGGIMTMLFLAVSLVALDLFVA